MRDSEVGFFLEAGLGYYAPETDIGDGDPGLRLAVGTALSVAGRDSGAELEIRLEGHKVFSGGNRDRDFLRPLIGLVLRR